MVMGMTTMVTLRYEGAPSCVDCQRVGVPVCTHVGFHEEAWQVTGQGVHVAGLDDRYEHVLRSVDVAPDRKTVTLVIDTVRPHGTDLARQLSWRPGPKSYIQAVHHDTGDTIENGRYDFLLQQGQTVYHGADRYVVHTVEHPARDPVTGIADGPDIQVATLKPMVEPPVSPAM